MNQTEVLEILKVIITPTIGILGVWLGNHLSRQNNTEIQKEFMARKIRIEKLQEITVDLMEYLRKIAEISFLMVRYGKKEIDHAEYKRINDAKQNEILHFHRKLVANEVFISELATDFDKLLDEVEVITNKMYEKYYDPNTTTRFFNDDEITYNVIKSNVAQALDVGKEIVKKLNQKLSDEIKSLE